MANSTLTMSSETSKVLFGYNASYAAAWVGGILFSLSALLHLVQYFKNRAWFLYLMLFGTLLEVAGYWTRVISIKNPSNHSASSFTFLSSTLAPSFLAAGCYMAFGRIIYWVTPVSHRGFKKIWVPVRFVAFLFITFDMLSFFIQIIGVFVLIAHLTREDSTVSQRTKSLKMTYDILRIGFIMQIITFGFFMLIALRFMFVSKTWRYDWPNGASGSWRTLAWTVTGSAVLITGRSLYRCLEFTIHRGDNYLRKHEWTFYLFDCLLILIVLLAFNLVHPGAHLPHEFATIGHAYKKLGGVPAVKVAEDDQPTAGYSRVSLVPPPLAPLNNNAPPMNQTNNAMHFSDPWNNRPSPGADRY